MKTLTVLFVLLTAATASANQTCKSENWKTRSYGYDADKGKAVQKDTPVSGQVCIDWEVRNDQVAKLRAYHQVVNGKWSQVLYLFSLENKKSKDLDNVCKRIGYREAFTFRSGPKYDFFKTSSADALKMSGFHEYIDGGLASNSEAYPAAVFCRK